MGDKDGDRDEEAMEAPRFTCQTCHAILRNREEHLVHHKSDFHRFNLKRKMINLPPVTLEQFNAKVAELKKAEEKAPTNIIECTVCRKKFATENSFSNHINSNKHKERVATRRAEQTREEQTEVDTVPIRKEKEREKAAEVPVDKEDTRTMEEIIDEKIKSARKILLEECMFCLLKHEDLDSNVEHMEKEHGFFIPDREHLKDLEGFLEYLGEKLSIGNVCLWCNEKSPTFKTLRGVQNHMIALAHCKLAYEPEDEVEYEEFYDFTTQNNENALVESAISDASTEYQIVFKNGAAIGHRSLQRYYRQKYKASDKRDVVLANAEANQFKFAGWYKDAIHEDKLRQAGEASHYRNKDQMLMGMRGNFLWRFRKDNVTTRNSGR